MTCPFDVVHYRELLQAAREGGYRFAFFDHEPQPGDLFLRHDVDLALPAAVELAGVEQEEGAVATYFLMRESVFYNLDSDEGRWAIEQLRGQGHRVGLHAVWPNAGLDDRFDPVIAWHNPDPPYMSRAGRRGGQRHAAAVVHAGALPLRLEPALAQRLPA